MRVTEMLVEYKSLEDENDVRKFVIKKMVPIEGLAVLKELLTRAMPVDLLGTLSAGDANNNIGRMLGLAGNVKMRSEMSIDEFTQFLKRLLKNAYEVLPVGQVQVYNKDGTCNINNFEDDMFLNLWLIAKVIEVNYKDFFIEALQRAGLQQATEETIQNATETITNMIT